MRLVLAILAVLIPALVVGEPLQSAKKPAIPTGSNWTKKAFDVAVAHCEKRIGEVEPLLPKQNLNAYCFCFISRTMEVFPRGIPDTLDEKTTKRMEAMVHECYEKHITPWADGQCAPKKSYRGKKGVDL